MALSFVGTANNGRPWGRRVHTRKTRRRYIVSTHARGSYLYTTPTYCPDKALATAVLCVCPVCPGALVAKVGTPTSMLQHGAYVLAATVGTAQLAGNVIESQSL